MNVDALAHKYEQCCTEPSDINEHLPTFVKAIDEVGATSVIELGVRYGVSTIGWLYGLNGKGHLWSVDCAFPGARPNDPLLRAPEEETSLLDSQVPGGIGIVEYWTFLLGYDDWPAILDALPTETDIVFIDTQHTYEQTLLELNLYYPRVRSGGRIFLHDTALESTPNATTPQPPYPVLTAMTEFCETNNLKWDNNPNCSGLGTIYC